MMAIRARSLPLAAAVLAASLAGAPAASQGLDAKRREAARLQGEIQKQGRKLSLANEDYLDAQLRREGLDVKVARARRELARAQDRWEELKSRLGRRVRLLYMHPGAWAATLLEASSLGDLARRHVLAGSVLTFDTELLLKTEKARADITARQRDLEVVRAEAGEEEKEIGARRAVVSKELRAQQALLSKVQGDIARIIEAERQRAIAEAARRAASAKGGLSFGVPAPKNVGPVRPAAAKAIAVAQAQLGKPYSWGAAGPGSFDCSGLTMYAWGGAGVSLPHSSRAQFASLPRVANDQIQPGDLLFFGSPIHHVGLYEGGGVMLNAPETGENVRRDSIYRRDFVGAARP